MSSESEQNKSPSLAKHTDTRSWLHDQGDAILREQVELARVPAPPFREGERAQLLAEKLRSLAIETEIDEVGNLLAYFPSHGHPGAPIIVAAHVDTVFGPDTPIQMRVEGDRWIGPGISDNARGLAVTLAVLRALRRGQIAPRHPLVFAFTVGEEGPGDLRGVKHLMRQGSPLRDAAAFLAVDGCGLRRIIHQALGSRRYRITIRGPGGHSWTDWGRPNPANALGEFIQRLATLELPTTPRSTLTVSRLGGGTSINAIPAETWLEVDLRSTSASTLQDIEARLREALAAGLASEEGRRGTGLSVEVQLIGERPAGELPAAHPLVAAAEQATRQLGAEPKPAASSTDANVPLAVGIPAIAIGAGGRAGDTHTLNEWFEDTDGAAAALRLFTLLATLAGF